MLGHQLVLCDVDEQILLNKDLYTALGTIGDACRAAQESNGHTRHGLYGDHDAGVEGTVDKMGHVVAQLLHSDVLVCVELDPDGTDIGLGVRVLLCRGVGVLCEHIFGGLAGEVEARTAGKRSVLGPRDGHGLAHTQARRPRAHISWRTLRATWSCRLRQSCSPLCTVSAQSMVFQSACATHPVVHHLLGCPPDSPQANKRRAVLFAFHVCRR